MIEFHQTRMGRTYYEQHVPSLVHEWQLADTIKGYAKDGWTLKHYIPQHLSIDDEQLVRTVLVFEK